MHPVCFTMIYKYRTGQSDLISKMVVLAGLTSCNILYTQHTVAPRYNKGVGVYEMEPRCTETYGLEKYGRFSIVLVTRWNIWTSNVVRRRGNCNLLNKLCDNWLDVHFYSINALRIYAKSVHSIPRMRIRPLLRPYFSTSRCFATAL